MAPQTTAMQFCTLGIGLHLLPLEVDPCVRLRKPVIAKRRPAVLQRWCRPIMCAHEPAPVRPDVPQHEGTGNG